MSSARLPVSIAVAAAEAGDTYVLTGSTSKTIETSVPFDAIDWSTHNSGVAEFFCLRSALGNPSPMSGASSVRSRTSGMVLRLAMLSCPTTISSEGGAPTALCCEKKFCQFINLPSRVATFLLLFFKL